MASNQGNRRCRCHIKVNSSLKVCSDVSYDGTQNPRLDVSFGTTFEFFTVCTKLAEMAILYSKDLTTAKKRVTSSGVRPDATDYYWFRSPMPNQMS